MLYQNKEKPELTVLFYEYLYSALEKNCGIFNISDIFSFFFLFQVIMQSPHEKVVSETA